MKEANGERPPASDGRLEDGHKFLHAVSRRLEGETAVVMIVDDEPSIRLLVRTQLAKIGPHIQCVEAASGKEAMTRLVEIRTRTRRDPALIILDLKMPEMDGWAVLEAMKKDYEARGLEQGTPIIVLSATSGERGLFFKDSVHDGKTGYEPLVTVAKENCVNAAKYFASGEKALLGWVGHFLGLAH
jgi:CheY-like chemotaxis protein